MRVTQVDPWTPDCQGCRNVKFIEVWLPLLCGYPWFVKPTGLRFYWCEESSDDCYKWHLVAELQQWFQPGWGTGLLTESPFTLNICLSCWEQIVHNLKEKQLFADFSNPFSSNTHTHTHTGAGGNPADPFLNPNAIFISRKDTVWPGIHSAVHCQTFLCLHVPVCVCSFPDGSSTCFPCCADLISTGN